MTNSRNLPTESVVIRFATGQDQDALEHLAALDSSRVPAEPLLIAERGGAPLAALTLTGGKPIANPFLPTADVIELLRLRARQVQPTTVGHHRLLGWAAASRNPVRHARNRLHRLLEGADVAV
ncbi:MAG TPA: hypothetical protein VMD09_10815 [Solirubrobacteraceae bacterium]|nr:hypothetical protein [Solirubrobacteraceae bacterium]